MASTASKAPINKSFAEVAKGTVEKPDFFDSAVSDIKLPPSYPHKRIPNTKERFSFFVDLQSTDATQTEVADAMPTSGIIGVNPRRSLQVVEFVCEDEDTQKAMLETTFHVEGKRSFLAIMPRHLLAPTVLVKLSNVPYGREGTIKQAIRTHWNSYGRILDISPCKYPGKPWLTKRWDILIQLSNGLKKLTAPVVFQLNGYDDTIVCSWRGSKKACLKCKCAGHSTSFCPGVAPKVGETVNPHQKIDNNGQSEKGKTKGPEISSGFSVEVPITPAAAQPPITATTSTAAGILRSPFTTPVSPAPEEEIPAWSLPRRTPRPATPPTTHPSPITAGDSPQRKIPRNQRQTRTMTRSQSSSSASMQQPTIKKNTAAKGAKPTWYFVCSICESREHDALTCPQNPTRSNTFAPLITDDDSHNDDGLVDDPME